MSWARVGIRGRVRKSRLRAAPRTRPLRALGDSFHSRARTPGDVLQRAAQGALGDSPPRTGRAPTHASRPPCTPTPATGVLLLERLRPRRPSLERLRPRLLRSPTRPLRRTLRPRDEVLAAPHGRGQTHGSRRARAAETASVPQGRVGARSSSPRTRPGAPSNTPQSFCFKMSLKGSDTSPLRLLAAREEEASGHKLSGEGFSVSICLAPSLSLSLQVLASTGIM